MVNERLTSADTVAHLYQSVTGEAPDEDSMQRMRRVGDALGLNGNDALWSILAALEYYLRLYEEIPDDIRDAGDFALQTWQKQATETNRQIAADEAEMRQRCAATIQLMRRFTEEHHAKYQLTIAKLNEAGLQALVARATQAISMAVGNRMVGTLNAALKAHREELETARHTFTQSLKGAHAQVEVAARNTIARLSRAARWLTFGLPFAMVAAAVVMIGVQWWMTDHALNTAHDEITALAQTKAALDQQIHEARNSYARFTAHTDGTYFMSGKDGIFLVSPGGFGDVTQCGAGLGAPCIRIQSQR